MTVASSARPSCPRRSRAPASEMQRADRRDDRQGTRTRTRARPVFCSSTENFVFSTSAICPGRHSFSSLVRTTRSGPSTSISSLTTEDPTRLSPRLCGVQTACLAAQQRRDEGRRGGDVQVPSTKHGSRRCLAIASVERGGRRQLRGRAHREPRRNDRALDQSCSECRWIVRGNERADGSVAGLRGALMPP